MTSRLVVGCAVAATLSACVPPNPTSRGPRPLKPQDGPRASIYVDHYGGAFSRHIRTRFRLDRDGYAMVGHLGGDGQIRVLYPETPSASGWVSGGETIWLNRMAAPYDMAPHLYTFARVPYRNMAAMTDSYDGQGHGYVFIVTSLQPIDLRAFAGNRSFEVLELRDYDFETDPRIAVRELAEELATGPFTLRYATSDWLRSRLTTSCPTQWGLMSYEPYFRHWPPLGYSLFAYPGMTIVNGLAFANYYGAGNWCRGAYYSGLPFYYRSAIYNPRLPTGAPQAPVTPELQRPTRRTLDNPERRGPLMSGYSSFGRRSGFDRERTSRRPVLTRPPDAPRSRDRETPRPRSGDVQRPQRTSRPADAPRANRPSAPAQPPAPAAKGDDGKAKGPPTPQ